MRNRTKGREYALQMLYQADIRKAPQEAVLNGFWQEEAPPEDVKGFAEQLFAGTMAHKADLDQLITKHAANWDLKRMAVIDRNILRLGTFELMHGNDAPPKVCINEAIELAKRFGDSESSKFINGILDAIHKAHGRENS